ncbi:LOW QUALITY PROTEIN: hypothetical protein U9M48_044640 [Paspalum notatum var. saurae]|uniref:non-specific serine/threonine protein kinase n=1 Tax=Paspalum notatum var. saurae TaxID=547442 RepID=A0AAQ3UXA8_PASNO
MPTRMVAPSWLLLIGLAIAGVLQAQPDSNGFINVDCGLPGTANSMDDTTKLSYAPDAAFTDSGSNHNISAEFVTPTLSKRYLNLPRRRAQLLHAPILVAGLKYLIRAEFMYGSYDGLNRLPVFDVYTGVNFWSMVNVTSADLNGMVTLEAIVVVPDDSAQVCLVNTGSGTPFISSLELRPLKSSIYPQASTTLGLVLLGRRNLGPTDATDIVRYPDDPHDRVWTPLVNTTAWDTISTTSTVQNYQNDEFEAPSKVMQTAITPLNGSSNSSIDELFWYSELQPKDPTPKYIAIMYFSELQLLPSSAVRDLYITINDVFWSTFMPDYLYSGYVGDQTPTWSGSDRYNISISTTANSTLPPIINAVEVYSVISTTNVATDSADVSAITDIKVMYRVQKNWMGDPCVPKSFAWDGLTCNYPISSTPTITGVNISFSGLNGDMSSSFADLKGVQYLDLSYNNLTGSIPDALSQLTSLKVLNLSSNQLSGSIPYGLLKRIQDGSLTMRYDDNPNLCTNAASCQPPVKGKKSKLAVYVAVPLVLVVVIISVVALLFCFLQRRKKQGGTCMHQMSASAIFPTQGVQSTRLMFVNLYHVHRIGDVRLSHASAAPRPQGGDTHDALSSLNLGNRRFSYKELEMITNNFERVLGQGGFGKVYDGFLEDGTQVAVKLRSQYSNQGVKEFLLEAQILTRIHHKNLVSMIGYCKDGQYMALVYEYMSEGALQEQLAGNGRNGRYLTWWQRLRIALDSAQGLEYLHKGCNPPLIHRDVKATNILLNTNLEAKIADFGFSKAFNHGNEAQISTNALVGTPGYVDPEYQATLQPTTKSDVYSFGVVMLELVTGKPTILSDPEPASIIQWVRRRLARGNIEDVVDTRMRGEYEVNSVWKVADIALKCTMQESAQRPTMTDVVAQLRECLELEEGRRTGGGTRGSFYAGSSNNNANLGYYDSQSTDASQISTAFEMEHNFGRAVGMGTDEKGLHLQLVNSSLQYP